MHAAQTSDAQLQQHGKATVALVLTVRHRHRSERTTNKAIHDADASCNLCRRSM